MPNGGSDCCGTCWHNRVNEGRAGYDRPGEAKGVADHCVIRDLAITNPFYTYCANHPHHMPDGGDIPVGPVFTGDSFGNREAWRPAPDTEEIRLALLNMVDGLAQVVSRDAYPFFGPGIGAIVVQQLVDYRETRAIPLLERLLSQYPGDEWLAVALQELTGASETSE